MSRTMAIVVVVLTLVVGVAAGCIFQDELTPDASADSDAKYEYEVVMPLLSNSKTKNRQKIEETIAGKSKFGWRLVQVNDGLLYFERPVSE